MISTQSPIIIKDIVIKNNHRQTHQTSWALYIGTGQKFTLFRMTKVDLYPELHPKNIWRSTPRITCLFQAVLTGLTLILLVVQPVNLQADVWSFFWENDLLVGSDDHYTNGIGLAWFTDKMCSDELSHLEKEYGNFMRNLVGSLPYVHLEQCQQLAGIKVFQQIITPTDTSEEDLIEDDVPYAGYLSFTFLLMTQREESVSRYHFNLGVIGPNSGAETTQKSFHRLIGNDGPRGWKHQLKTQYTMGIGYHNATTLLSQTTGAGNTIDLIRIGGFELGNFFSGAQIGGKLRYGYNFPTLEDFVDGVGLEGIESSFRATTQSLDYGWSVNLAAYLTAVAHIYVIDNASNHDLSRRALYYTQAFSVSLYLEKIQISFSLEAMVALFRDSMLNSGWGGVDLSRRF